MQKNRGELDIILFGASGFTGTHCIESLHKLIKAYGLGLTWGIAGRSEKKLKDALNEYENTIGDDLSAIPIIIADTGDFESLKIMTANAKVVINCCGPFRLYGEPVVKACIETGTHQVDITGEPMYIETIDSKYHKAAEEKGIYIVSACGFESIPVDLGVLLLQDKFEGTINSIEAYLELVLGNRGSSVNYGTYETFVYAAGEIKEESTRLRQKLFPTSMPIFYPKLKSRPFVHRSTLINKWCIPLITSDRSIVQRTQHYIFNNNGVRPLQIQTYIGFPSFLVSLIMGILFLMFIFVTQGGVYTPGIAFRKTSLLKMAQENGLEVEML